jgi:hypothetical protein
MAPERTKDCVPQRLRIVAEVEHVLDAGADDVSDLRHHVRRGDEGELHWP